MHVQYGCGPYSAPEGWVNFDSSLTLRWEKVPGLGKLWTKNSQRYAPHVLVGDIVKGLPVPDSSCNGLYASHVLEHLSLTEFHTAVENSRKLLAESGIFRLIVPDLEWAAKEYLTRLGKSDRQANNFFLDETHLGQRNRPKGLAGLVYEHFRTSKHLWMWDFAGLKDALEKHGFNSVRRCAFGDSQDPAFAAVEEHSRFENAVAIEARP